MYCLSKEITGIEKDLVFDKDKNLINREKLETDIFIGKDDNFNSITYFSKNAGTNLELEIPIKYKNMWSFIRKNPDWSSVLGFEKFVSMSLKLIKQTESFLNNENNKYYYNDIINHYNLFKEVKSAKVNKNNLLKYINSVEKYRAKQILETIEKETMTFKPIKYSLFNTTTGRMTISSGLNLLTLKKENRNIIGSSYDEGKILEIDIKNLEPRILMGMFNKEVPEDIYSWIANEVLHDISVDRNFIKELTFKILYGASMNTIKKDLSWMHDIEDIVNRIKSNMGYQELALKIKSEMQEGYFRNYYGRKLKNSSANINHYLQSTGVDVSMYCFSKINNILKQAGMRFKIIGFIHDAMIIDTDKTSSETIIKNLNEKNISVQGFNNKFPIIITEVL
tara:strand:- start:5666 stop:6847 length:1182 start_codon:yes stop_codon:yes gene_type:complete